MTSPFKRRAVLYALLLRAVGFSQNPGASVSGTVTDPAGAMVAGARVEARNLGTGLVSTAPTNEAGMYVFATLNPGVYQITTGHPGLQRYVLSGLDLEVGAKLTLNLSLKVGTATETVEVQAGAAQQVGYAT